MGPPWDETEAVPAREGECQDAYSAAEYRAGDEMFRAAMAAADP